MYLNNEASYADNGRYTIEKSREYVALNCEHAVYEEGIEFQVHGSVHRCNNLNKNAN